jgi:hypothetical protein
VPKPIPERACGELVERLDVHASRRWSALGAIGVRFRTPFAYVSAEMPEGYTQPLFRLRWTGSRDRWGFAIWLASKDGYAVSVLPSGSFTGSPEEAMDCACGLYLRDVSAWRVQRGKRSLPPH